MKTLVTLTTDFGTRDSYVAQLKGVLYTYGPDSLEVIDLTHDIAAQNVFEAALFVRAAWPRFPARTIHVVVVDPGVGSARRALALRVRADGLGDQHWLGPDNGVLSLVLADVAESEAIELEPARFVSATPSATFHGRDVFAPAAARLAHGAALASLGAALTHAPVRLAWPETTRVATSLRGRVVHVDRFGNLISNLTRADLAAFAFECGVVPVTGLRVRLDVAAQPNAWLNLGQCYADVPAATALALFGSSELLEVAVANGHAADLFGVGVGAEVTVEVRS